MTLIPLKTPLPPLEMIFPERKPLEIVTEPRTEPIAFGFPAGVPASVDLIAIQRGMRGKEGPRGPPGESVNEVELPDLTLIFNNVLTGPP